MKQVRPLVPRSWKNGLFVSISPAVLTVRSTPLESDDVSWFAAGSSAWVTPTAASIPPVAAIDAMMTTVRQRETVNT